jgi:hypothetical protein
MDHDALDTYLNDHLAGATLGCEHARRLEAAYESSAFGTVMTNLAMEIEEDRDTLVDLMERLDTPRNPVKAATAWVAEKAGRVKFSGASSGDRDLGNYLALETLSLGVEGKRSLWTALESIAADYPELGSVDLAALVARAEAQRAALEEQRIVAARQAFGIAEREPGAAR